MSGVRLVHEFWHWTGAVSNQNLQILIGDGHRSGVGVLGPGGLRSSIELERIHFSEPDAFRIKCVCVLYQ